MPSPHLAPTPSCMPRVLSDSAFCCLRPWTSTQELVPYVLGTLIDYNQPAWALELAKQLMYSEGKEPSSTSNGAGAGIDYSVLGWAMAQVGCAGRHARMCSD